MNDKIRQSSKEPVKTIGIMTIIILLAKFCGVLRDIMFANLYGTSFEADVFTSASRLPLLFFDLTLGAAILATFIPVFNKLLTSGGKPRAFDFANNFFSVVSVFALIFCILGVIFSRQIVAFLLPKFEPAKIEATAKILRILFPVIIFTALAFSSVGILQSFDEFNIPSLISLVSNGIMILYFVIFGKKFGVAGIAVSMLIGWSAQFFVQIPALRGMGFRYKFAFDLKDSAIREVVKLAIPVLISSWVQPICVAINMVFASGFGDGAVAGLDYANKLYVIFVGIFAYAVTNFIFPRLSRMDSENDENSFASTAKISLGYTIYIITPIMALFISLARPIIQLVYQRGAFNDVSVDLTSAALLFYSMGMISFAISEILNKTFYAMHDGKTPMLASVAGIICNIGTAAVLVLKFNTNVGGIALSSSVGITVTSVILMAVISKRRMGIIDNKFLVNFVKIIISGAFASLTAYCIFSLINQCFTLDFAFLSQFLKLFIASGAGFVVYLSLNWILKVTEQQNLISKLIRR